MKFPTDFRVLRLPLCLGLMLVAGPIANARQDESNTSHTPIRAVQDVERFSPQPSASEIRLDWAMWDKALAWFVLSMGPSTRELPPKVEPAIGSRFVFGHTSRYRLEGNRIGFSIMDEDVRAMLSEYRRDLEQIGNEIDLASLPRDEQLAYWINLHNVAVIEQIALAYPVMSPRKVTPAGQNAWLDEARFITVNDVALSPRDIRTRIVYPNWRDPRVIYAFFRGEIGGPSIPRIAYTGGNASELLDSQAREFVNSLRGVAKHGETLAVSQIYKEAQPFYFPNWSSDLRAHLSRFAKDDVAAILGTTGVIEATTYETDIADLSKGESAPTYLFTESCSGSGPDQICTMPRPDFDAAEARFLTERAEKFRRLIERGRTGQVIVLAPEEPGKRDEEHEVE